MAKNKYIEECNLIDAMDWDADKKQWTIDDKKLNDIPAADVAPVVHARWVNPHWLGSTSAANCSACNFEAQHREYRGVQKFYKYCPGCGAIMDLEQSK